MKQGGVAGSGKATEEFDSTEIEAEAGKACRPNAQAGKFLRGSIGKVNRITESQVVSAIGAAQFERYRLLTARPATGRIACPQPRSWESTVGDALFFEIFQLAGCWKVSLIIQASHDAPVLRRLRDRECLFLITALGWEMPRSRAGRKTMAIYKKVIAGNGCNEADAIKAGFMEIESALRHGTMNPSTQATLGWKEVLDVVEGSERGRKL